MSPFTTPSAAKRGMRTLATALAASLVTSLAQAGTLEVLVVDRDGKPLPDAVVVVQPSAPGAGTKKALPLSATVNQEKMQFLPAVSIVGLGAKVRFTNNDAWDHHVRLTSPGSVASTTPSNTDGMSLRLELAGYRYEYSELTIDSIDDEVVGPSEVRRYLPQEIADAVNAWLRSEEAASNIDAHCQYTAMFSDASGGIRGRWEFMDPAAGTVSV